MVSKTIQFLATKTSSSLLLLFIWAILTAAVPAIQQSFSFPELGGSWHKYVKAPDGNPITPVLWVADYTSGNITNPDGLVGHGTTILTRSDPDEDVPSIVVDFGQNYAGILTVNFDGAEPSSQAGSSTTSLPGITLAFSETLEFLTDRSDFTRSDNQASGSKYTNGTDQIAVQKKPYTWKNKLGCQFPDEHKVCSDGFHGFRYLRISLQALPEDAPYTTGFGSVSIPSISLTYSGYRGTPDTFTGYFECSDEDLTQWWYDAVYTNDLATDIFRADDAEPRDAASPGLLGKEVLHDGAKRDRDPYVGDLAISGLTAYLSHNNGAAARNVLADLADHQREDGWIPPASINNYSLALFDYPLWWVVCSNDLVMYTGDLDYLDTYYTNIVKVLDVYYPSCTNSDGLLEKGLGNSDGYGDYAFLPRTGVITYYNALYALALNRAAQLADFHDRPDDAERWRGRAAAIGPALLKENWDPDVGAFFDGGACPDEGDSTAKCPVHAQDGNSLAILGFVKDNFLAARGILGRGTTVPMISILNYLSSALARPYGNAFYDSNILSPEDNFDRRVYAFISYFEIAARFQEEYDIPLVESAFDEIRRLYGWMARNDPFGTFWEGIGPEGSPYEGGYTSMAHGWSTGIVPLMVNYISGLTPWLPGFRGWTVNPQTEGGGLTWARSGVASVFGGIETEWCNDACPDGSAMSLTVSSPAGTTGTVHVPVADDDSELRKNGEVIWTRNGEGTVNGVAFQGGRVVVTVEGGGTHVFRTA